LIEDQSILVECIWQDMCVSQNRPEVFNALNSYNHFLLEEAFKLNYPVHAKLLATDDTFQGR